MSEYWVSQAKFYCKFCNCHIADNKPSRQHHENGFKHKQQVELFNRQKRDEKLHGARSEQDLQRQLAEINRAAKEAISVDRSQPDSSYYVEPSAPPPPAPRPPSYIPGFIPSNAAEENDPDVVEDNSAVYVVRGQGYLNGKAHEDKIVVGAKCEIYIERLDEWSPGNILRRTEMPVPNTSVTIKTFEVSYLITQPESGKQLTMYEKRVKSDRIRLLVSETGEVQGDIPSAEGFHFEPTINKDTGLGVWQTLSVREVDEDREREQSELAAMEMREEHNPVSAATTAVINAKRAALGVVAEAYVEADSSLGAYDPYKKNVYRGVHLVDSDDRKNEIESIAMGEVVGFRKRRKVAADETVGAAVEGSGDAVDSAVRVKAEAKEEATTEVKPESSSSSNGAGEEVKVKRVMGGGGNARKFRKKDSEI